MPNLYIIAGCNGAGKTTSSYTILPEMLDCKEFVNADNIAAGLSPFNPESVAIEAGRIMLAKIDALLLEGANFAIETTLATRSYLGLIRKAKVKNYKVTLLYFWLNSYQEAIQRVAIRVKNGGHFIPDDVVKRRYFRGVHYFFELYRFECDFWLMINNTNGTPLMVAEGEFNLEKVIYNDEIWNKIEPQSNDNQA